MALRRGGGDQTNTIMMILLFGIVSLYIFSQIVTFTGTDITNFDFSKVGSATFTAIKILIVGVAVWIGVAMAGRVGKPLSRRDYLTMIVIGVVLYFLWKYLVGPVMAAPSFDNITFQVGAKLGLL